jgi:two-component system, OmpR family, phosphate regulon sensor histidine kinase PhoR
VTSTDARSFDTMSRLAPSDLAAVLHHLPSGAIVLDAGHTVRYSNLAAQRIFHPHRLVDGAPIPDLGWEPPLEQVLARLSRNRVVREEEMRAGERFLLVEGRVYGDARLAVLQVDDLTARARRIRSEERFITDVAHEILGPLGAIASAANVLQESGKDDPEARARFIAHIAERTDRLVSTATALLVLARAESGGEPPRLELVPVRPILEEIAGRSGEVAVECSERVGVLADADLLRQAVVTLVDNARRHSRDRVVITAADGNDTVEIDVLDTGVGILPEHLERVTDRFYSGVGRDSGGFGIGLSIAARAAKVLGGTLDVSSTRSGTRARLQLPSARIL